MNKQSWDEPSNLQLPGIQNNDIVEYMKFFVKDFKLCGLGLIVDPE